jgi:DNA processing protein
VVTPDEWHEEKLSRLLVAEINGVGPVTFERWLKIFSSMKHLWQASRDELLQKLKIKEVDWITQQRQKRGNGLDHLKALTSQDIKVLVLGMDDDYPKGIAILKNPPPVIYLRGQLEPADQKAIAVVGTRRPTSYGVEVTEQLVTALVGEGFTIISGLAYGVDEIAHEAALKAGGRTIGLLASGIDWITPREHEALGRKILNQGALLSAFAPGESARRGNFVARNRLVAGMSLGVLVTEGAIQSGTRITADYAVAQNKLVFAVPGPITSQMSQGPSLLLKHGAKLVTGVEDILVALNQIDTDNLKGKNQ